MDSDDHMRLLKLLGLPTAASGQEIHKAYRNYMKKHGLIAVGLATSSDTSPEAEEFKKITALYADFKKPAADESASLKSSESIAPAIRTEKECADYCAALNRLDMRHSANSEAAYALAKYLASLPSGPRNLTAIKILGIVTAEHLVACQIGSLLYNRIKEAVPAELFVKTLPAHIDAINKAACNAKTGKVHISVLQTHEGTEITGQIARHSVARLIEHLAATADRATARQIKNGVDAALWKAMGRKPVFPLRAAVEKIAPPSILSRTKAATMELLMQRARDIGCGRQTYRSPRSPRRANPIDRDRHKL